MRLIDADELLKRRRKVVEYDEAGFSMDYFAVPVEEINNAPTVEASPVVHGEWISDQVETGDPFGEGFYLIDILHCSACGGIFDVSDAGNFCPNCGADMRKKVE